ncbi:hypothetical protein SMX45_002736 [Cronobacter turicensis]|nr:hypothetical protein [Cronobacter turicensis]
MDDEKAGLVLKAIGLAVVDLVAGQVPITKDNLVERLEHNGGVTGIVKDKEASTEAAEIVRKGQ